MLYPDYTTADELKRYLRIPGVYENTLSTEDDIYDDIEIALAITSASRAIDTVCNRQFGNLTTEAPMYYTAYWDRKRQRYVAEIDDLMNTTGMTVESESSVITDYSLFPINAAVKGKPYTMIIFGTSASISNQENDIEVEALWGWTAVPDTIKNATLLQAARFFKRRDAPFGIAGSPELGSELRLLAKVDPDVEVMLRPYKRRWGAV